MARNQWPPAQTKKRLHCLKWRPRKARRLVYKPSYAKKERNGPPSANQRLSTAKPRSIHAVSTLWVHPPTSPCSTLSARTERKSKGHYWKWHHKLKIWQFQLKSSAVKGLRQPLPLRPLLLVPVALILYKMTCLKQPPVYRVASNTGPLGDHYREVTPYPFSPSWVLRLMCSLVPATQYSV